MIKFKFNKRVYIWDVKAFMGNILSLVLAMGIVYLALRIVLFTCYLGLYDYIIFKIY